MKKTTTQLALVAILSAQLSHAGSVNVQTHVPAGNSTYVKNESATGPGTNRFLFGVDYNWVNDALVELNPTRERRLDTLVDGIQTLDLMVARDFGGVLALGIGLPLHMIHEVDQPNAFAMGDVRFFGKLYLLGAGESRALKLSLIPEMSLPTGDSGKFLSDGSAGYGARLALEKNFGGFSAVANFGYRSNPGAVFRDMDYRQKLPMGVGVMVPLTAKWAVNAEASGNRILPLNKYNNPAEFYAGARYQINEQAVLTGGAALGSTNEVASADYRVLVGLKFTPFAARQTDRVMVTRAKSVQATPDGIELGREVRFAHDSAVLLPSSKPLLNEVAKVLKENPEKFAVLNVEGHCNELGSDEYNLGLSKRRSESVRAYLVSQGIEASRLQPEGYGKRRPKPESAKLPRERRLEVNRRVEFKAIKTLSM